MGEMHCFKDTLRSAEGFRNQTAAFDSCLCYFLLNLRKGRWHRFVQTIYMRGHVYFVSSSTKVRCKIFGDVHELQCALFSAMSQSQKCHFFYSVSYCITLMSNEMMSRVVYGLDV